MSWTTIILIVVSIILLWFLAPYIIIIFRGVQAKKYGYNAVFYQSYNVLRNRMKESATEEFAIINAFDGIRQRYPFTLLSSHDVNLIIETLEPFGKARPFLFSSLIFIADIKQDSTFLKNPKEIIRELISHCEHYQNQNKYFGGNSIVPLLNMVYTEKYNKATKYQDDINVFHSQLSSILEIFSKIEPINNEHYKIHNDLFNNPNQDIFVPIDMGKHLNHNTEMLEKMKEIKLQFGKIKKTGNIIPSTYDVIVVTFDEFIDSFVDTLLQLNKMLKSLYEKSKSFKNSTYDLKQYQRDLTNYKIAEQKYQFLKFEIDKMIQAYISKSSFN